MAWDCTQCGAIDLNTQTCPYCGARQDKASRTAQLRAQSPSPTFASQSDTRPDVPSIVYFFASIGYLFMVVSSILALFTGGGAVGGGSKRFDELDTGGLYIYAVGGFIAICVLIICLLFVFGPK